MKMLHGVLKGSQHALIYNVARIANLENATGPLVEDKFWAYSAIGAAEDCCERMLMPCGLATDFSIMARIGR
jgi:hypothetical protein